MTTPKTARVNARLAPDVAKKAVYLERRLEVSMTKVMEQAIERYYAEVSAGSGDAAEILTRTGFVGGAEGPSDLSRTYKAELARSLGKKG